jgi:hypothetical protein
MSSSSDPFAKVQAESDSHRVEFLKIELSLCFTFATIAARRYETGNQESARSSLVKAEKAYETVILFLSDPKHSKNMTDEEIRNLTAELESLHDKLERVRSDLENEGPVTP